MGRSVGATTANRRLDWLDSTRGLSILWIACFHFLIAHDNGRYPWPASLSSLAAFVEKCAGLPGRGSLGCAVEGSVAGLFQRGPHVVGVFLALSGFGLAFSLAPAENGVPVGGWRRWYRARLVRLFPLYWLAHLVYLVSPFLQRPDPVDWRFALSFLGDRIWPIDKVFYYANPAWWFFGLLVELYLVFPVLHRAMVWLGPGAYVAVCGLFTVGSRIALTEVLHAHGNWIQGAFFGARLFEFAAGMMLGRLFRLRPEAVERRFFSLPALLAGLALYGAGVACCRPGWLLALSDGLVGVGLLMVLARVARGLNALGPLRRTLTYVGAYSYGIYLLHQPYVMYVGGRLSGLGMPGALAILCVALAVIVFGSSLAERSLNRLTGR